MHRAGLRIESDDARGLAAVGAADVRDDAAVFDQRRAGGAEEALADVEPAHACRRSRRACRWRDRSRAAVPPRRTCRRVAGDHRHRARPFVEAEIVAIGGRVREVPVRLAGPRLECVDDFLAADAMEQDQPIAGHHRAGKSLADVFLPDSLGPPAGHVVASGGPV